jgi:hypothetical protein
LPYSPDCVEQEFSEVHWKGCNKWSICMIRALSLLAYDAFVA